MRNRDLGSTTAAVKPPLPPFLDKFNKLAAWTTSTVFSAVLLAILGFNTVNKDAAFPVFAAQHEALVIALGALAGVCIGAAYLSRFSRIRPQLAAAIPVGGYVLFALLLVLVVTRPTWCPTAFCPAPQVLPNPNGANDGTVEVYTTDVETTAYVIPGNPAQYSLGDLPNGVAAERIDQQGTPYRVVISVHSLKQSGYDILIERVELLIIAVPATPNPLAVYIRGPSTTRGPNLYQVRYHGEDAGQVLVADYTTVPLGHPQLVAGETDTLAIELSSSVRVDMRYRVRVTYRVVNDSAEHSLTVPGGFEVVFSDDTNWHPYHLQNGHLVPGA
jgi:hypothetical protein